MLPMYILKQIVVGVFFFILLSILNFSREIVKHWVQRKYRRKIASWFQLGFYLISHYAQRKKIVRIMGFFKITIREFFI